MARLDIERQNRLEPVRKEKALKELSKLICKGQLFDDVFYNITDKYVQFDFERYKITFWFYSGWHSGKTIKDGRGLKNLMKQLKK